MINGFIAVKKEENFTSNDVVAILRGICKQKKVGHTGTLDPNATGVLPVCLGNATKMCDLMHDFPKEYIATFRLGIETDTQDIWGSVTADTKDAYKEIPVETIEDVILSFQGPQMQIPPMYSAKKINGETLYDLARKGIEVERKACPIEVMEIEILGMKLPEITIRVVCSKGTYIRTICHDIGQKLGTLATMTALERTKAAGFCIEDALTIAQIQDLRDQDKLEECVFPTEKCFLQYMAVTCNETGDKYLNNGNMISLSHIELPDDFEKKLAMQEKAYVRVHNSKHQFCAVYEVNTATNTMKPWKMFMA